jgi:DNA-binding NarL/FixJ family response regulator
MVKVMVVDKNKLFVQSLKIAFEKDGFAQVLNDVESLDDLSHVLPEVTPDLILFDLDTGLIGLTVVYELSSKSPETIFLAMTADLNRSKYFRLIQAKARGCVLKSASLEELQKVVMEIMAGKVSFPEEIVNQNLVFSGSDKINNELTDRESEVLQLLCEGFSNDEIAERLHLSHDTIKWHRSNILTKSGCKNVLTLYKYAVKQNWVSAP